MNGPNDACPCFSGRKYRDCCLRHTNEPAQESPNDFFLGLSASELYDVVLPFYDRPDLIHVADRVESHPKGPMITVLDYLVDRVPLAHDPGSILPETNTKELENLLFELPEYAPVSDTRIRRNLAGYVLKTVLKTLAESQVLGLDDNRLVVADNFHEEVERRDYRRIYPILFRTMTTDVDWSTPFEEDIYDDLFGYALFQLARTGDEFLGIHHLALEFFSAFPMLMEWTNSKHDVDFATSRYLMAVIFNFWAVLGLVDFELERGYYITVRGNPLFRELIQFPEEWLIREKTDILQWD